MNPRYQVFISSTFRDLHTERQACLNAILELGHFPTGMEVFPAANSTPWALIEKIIKETDFYILIIGGMYGTVDEHGVSYTEREYDLALESGIPILAFLHKDPTVIPAGKSEMDPASRERLKSFRGKVEHHHCKFWANADELKAQIILGLVFEMGISKRLGWVRANLEEQADTFKKLASVMEENDRLKTQIKQMQDNLNETISDPNLAQGDDKFTFEFVPPSGERGTVETTWNTLLINLGESLMQPCQDVLFRFMLNHLLANVAATHLGLDPTSRGNFTQGFRLDERTVGQIILQFTALKYIEPYALVSQETINHEVRSRREHGYKFTQHGLNTYASMLAVRRP